MRMRSLLRGALVAGGLVLAGGIGPGSIPARAAGEAVEPPETKFSFDGLFGSFDRASAQRGFQVYKEVCSACHSLRLVAFRDLNPQAPFHVLVAPLDHHENAAASAAADPASLGHVVALADEVAQEAGNADYRMIVNTGAGAGQSVFHAHLHLLGGRPMKWPPG